MATSNYQNLLDNLYEGVYYVDTEKKIRYWSRGAEKITGYKSSETIGRFCSDDILMHKSLEGENFCNSNCMLSSTLSTGQVYKTEAYLKHKDGHQVHVSIRIAPMYGPKGNIVGVTQIFTDNKDHFQISKEDIKKHEDLFFDPVTRLPSKNYTDMIINARFGEFKRYSWPFGAFFFQIDNYDKMKSIYGDKIKDDILKQVTKIISDHFRSFDTLGKWSEKEFVAIIINVDEERMAKLGERLVKLVEKTSLPVGKGSVTLTISLGGTIATLKDSVEILINRLKELTEQSILKGGNCITTQLIS